jgi:hypothetical protein
VRRAACGAALRAPGAPAPRADVPLYRRRARAARGGGADHAPGPGAAWAGPLAASHGSRRQGSEGTQGPSAAAWARQRGPLGQEGLAERPVWRVRQRTVGPHPVASYALSQAPASTPWRLVVGLSGGRGAMAPGGAEGPTARGMDHEEGRQSPGWHHPRRTTRRAPGFLWPRQLRVGKTRAGSHRSAAPDVLGSGHTPADVYEGRGAGMGRVGTEAPSPSVSRASRAAARGRRALEREVGP